MKFEIPGMFDLKEIRTVIEIGCHAGRWMFRDSDRVSEFPNATFHCFEPAARPLAQFRQKILARSTERINAYQYALVGVPEWDEVYFHYGESDSCISSVLELDGVLKERGYPLKIYTVPAITMDNAVIKHNIRLDREVLLKADIQGYEYEFLKGAIKTLKQTDIVILEVCLTKQYKGQANFEDLIIYLKSFGIRYAGNVRQYGIGRSKPVSYIDALFVRD